MDKDMPKYFKNFIVFIVCILLLTACGPEETVQPSSPSRGEGLSFLSAMGKEGLEVAVESNTFYDVAPELEGGRFLRMQFYQGEPVQLWASAPYKEEDDAYVSVYMYRQDGTKEVCLEQVERDLGRQIGFRDSTGCLYSIQTEVKEDNGIVNSIIKLDSTGKILYTARMEGSVKKGSICELGDGRMAMLLYKGSSAQNFDLALLDAKGKYTVTAMSEPLPSQTYLGTSEEGLLLMKENHIYRIGLSDGKLESLFSFAQTVYSMKIEPGLELDFCVDLDGRLELLWSGNEICRTGLREALSLVELGQNRQKLVLEGIFIKNQAWLKEQIMKFNNTNGKYWVVIQTIGDNEENDDYITRIGVEIATGKGPDLLQGMYLLESPLDLIEKGGLVDLSLLMEQTGIKEEDYYPTAFDTWRTGESIYAVRYSAYVTERLISAEVLGNMENPDIEAVADALLAYPADAIYDGSSAASILRELLEGSETLWGMVDWENGDCDFDGELFAKLLEVAKRYQYDARNHYPAICSYRDCALVEHFYSFPTEEELLAEKYVPLGTLFDDGGHPVSLNAYPISINANSANKEGAWEFLQFLLGEDTQGGISKTDKALPVKKSAFRALLEEEILNGVTPEANVRVEAPLPRDRAEEIEAAVENIRALPVRTEAILEIVLEESQNYFDGSKEIGQVADVIENRVSLYLEERK